MRTTTEYTDEDSAGGPAAAAPERHQAPTWSRWYEVFRVVGHPPYLKRTVRIALIVGSILFTINHFDEVLGGRATAATWIKGAVPCCVPFCVSNLGMLLASRRPR